MCGKSRRVSNIVIVAAAIVCFVSAGEEGNDIKPGVRERIKQRLEERKAGSSTEVQTAGAAESGRQTANCNGVKISYIVEGKGEPVVLIHGFTASIMMNWQLPGIVALLAKDHQVIAIDMPGHGQSDKPEKESAYGTAMVEDVICVMDQCKIKKAHIVGYSMGGMIAAKLTARHPDRVTTCVLGGMGWLKEGSFLQKFFEGANGNKSGGNSGLGPPPACFQSFAKLALSEDELKSIKVPMTVIIGTTDPCRLMYVAPLAEVRKDVPVVLIEGAGHLECVANPQFKSEIKKWLDKH